MSSYMDFLEKLGFGNVLEEEFDLEDDDAYDIEYFGDIYRKNIEEMKGEFDDSFIIEMFSCFNNVFRCSDFCEKLGQIRKQFNTHMWSTLIAYEWDTTKESSVFKLMDSLVIGDFEANLGEICERVRAVWVNDYGDSEL